MVSRHEGLLQAQDQYFDRTGSIHDVTVMGDPGTYRGAGGVVGANVHRYVLGKAQRAGSVINKLSGKRGGHQHFRQFVSFDLKGPVKPLVPIAIPDRIVQSGKGRIGGVDEKPVGQAL